MDESPLPKQHSTTSTGIEAAITGANTGVFVGDMNRMELRQMFLFLYSLVGLQTANFPDKADEIVLNSFTVENFGTFRVNEIKLAFSLYASGKLDCDEKPYGKFSPAFFGAIMSAYRKVASGVHQYQSKTVETHKMQSETRGWCEELSDEYMANCSFSNYEKIGNPELIYPGSYATLQRNGFSITPDKQADIQRAYFEARGEGKKYTGIAENSEARLNKRFAAFIFDQIIAKGQTLNL